MRIKRTDCFRAEQVRLLYRSGPVGIVGAMGGALILAIITLHMRVQPLAIVQLWFVSLASIAAAHLLLMRAYSRATSQLSRWRQWARWFVALSLLEGAMWGVTAFNSPENLAQNLFTMLFMCAMTAGSGAAFGVYLPAYCAFLFPATVPFLAVSAARGGTLHYYLAAMVLVYIGGIFMVQIAYNSNFQETIQMRFENADLAEKLRLQKEAAEEANRAKSRFLAAASHDLRQPLQTLALLQALLATTVEGEKAKKLVGRIDEALDAMTAMLNTLLDINQIETGAVKAEAVSFPVNGLLDRLRDELTYHAMAAGLTLRVLPCAAWVRSDSRLLEQMIRNLLSNAIKYTQRGRVLVGCRRRGGVLRIEIWDTGLGIASSELEAIFDEYHQVDNPARQRSRGLGLGLSIVKSLGELLGHPIRVRSLPGKGSVFSIEVPTALNAEPPTARPAVAPASAPARDNHRLGSILIIEDDPEVREHLDLFLATEGYTAATAVDGPSALTWVASSGAPPDLVLADYNLPNGMNGVEVAKTLRKLHNRQIPFIILTGDITTDALRNIALHNCVQLNKPVKLRELTHAIDKLLALPALPLAAQPVRAVEAEPISAGPLIYVVDDDDQVRAAMRIVLEDGGRLVETYASSEAFLAAFQPGKPACLLIDAYLPGMSGLDLLRKLRAEGHSLPAIMITGDSDVAMAVEAMKAGALDFIEKPIGRDELIHSLDRALEMSEDSQKLSQWRISAAAHLAGLTLRQREVMERVLAGQPNKNIAADLGISQRTVENHRASIMKRTGSKSLPALARLALVAAGGDTEPAAAPSGAAVD